MSYKAKFPKWSEEKLLKNLHQDKICLTRREKLHKVLQGIVTEKLPSVKALAKQLPGVGMCVYTNKKAFLAGTQYVFIREREKVVGQDQAVKILGEIGVQLRLSLLSSVYDIQLGAGQCQNVNCKITLVVTEAAQMGHNVRVE